MTERWATFDCYGTLVDWNTGIGSALAELWPNSGREELLAAYHRHEAELEAGRGIPYRTVMAEALHELTQEFGATIPGGRSDALAKSLPRWPVFPEVPGALSELRERGWKLAILSNTDPDLLDASLRAIDVPVDLRVVASEIGSYKPALAHWQVFFDRSGAKRPGHVHVAASLFHDIEPCSRQGLRAVWINRLGESSDLPRDGELTNLADLPDLLDEIVPES
jgi:2-haloacid dehalogenase